MTTYTMLMRHAINLPLSTNVFSSILNTGWPALLKIISIVIIKKCTGVV